MSCIFTSCNFTPIFSAPLSGCQTCDRVGHDALVARVRLDKSDLLSKIYNSTAAFDARSRSDRPYYHGHTCVGLRRCRWPRSRHAVHISSQRYGYNEYGSSRICMTVIRNLVGKGNVFVRNEATVSSSVGMVQSDSSVSCHELTTSHAMIRKCRMCKS